MGPTEKAELLGLLWALCDRTITPREQDRLEQLVRQDPEACKLFTLYMGMIHTLAWARTGQRDTRPLPAQEAEVPAPVKNASVRLPAGRGHNFVGRFFSKRGRVAGIATLAATVLLAIGLIVFSPSRKEVASGGDGSIATLTGTDECRWGASDLPIEVGSRLAAGKMNLRAGLAEITFDSGVKVLLEGPSILEVESQSRVHLHSGKLMAHVPPSGHGFTVQTPRGTVVDLGTEFGIVAEPSGQTDVFTFAGSVLVTPVHGGAKSRTNQLAAGQALRLSESGEQALPIDSTPFVRLLPTPPKPVLRVQEMRQLAARHPKLLHHYTFEGERGQGEHLLDRKGGAPLRELAFGAGSTSEIQYPAGLDPSTVAFTPHRTGPTSGGAALRTETRITLPSRLTVECLVRPGSGCGEGYAVATRAAPHQRGYFVRKSHMGPHLGVAVGHSLRELIMPVRFVPGHWYYVATTCEHDGKETIVNMYVANVTAGQEVLSHVGRRSHTFPGTYGTTAHLRIGMGSPSPSHSPPRGRGQGEGAYAFSGSIDEVAIYGDVLSQAELQERLRILVAEPPVNMDGPALIKPPDDQ